MPLPWFLDEDAQRKKAKAKAHTEQRALRATMRGAFDEEDDESSEPMRHWLAEKWRTLSPQSKDLVRSQRARRGVRCEVCGTVGYYKELCVNDCRLQGLETPDSMDLTPPPSPAGAKSKNGRGGGSASSPEKAAAPVGLGVLWGNTGFTGVGLTALGVTKDGSAIIANRAAAGAEEKNAKHVKRKADLSHLRQDSTERLHELQVRASLRLS